MTPLLYKILRTPEWNAAHENPAYRGSVDDVRDGFIHFSTRAQLEGTLNKYFVSETNIIVLAFEPSIFDQTLLKWEPSRDGALFPHLYGPLNVAKNCFQTTLRARPEGGFDLSSLPEKELS